jgi:high-affinity Fe2+/Pb2+ permease
VKKQSRFFRHDVIMSAITLFIVGGLVYTGVSALKENEISPLQREYGLTK